MGPEEPDPQTGHCEDGWAPLAKAYGRNTLMADMSAEPAEKLDS